MQTMRAAVMRDRKLVVADVPAPTPGPGEVLVRTLACGICGSDLHALKSRRAVRRDRAPGRQPSRHGPRAATSSWATSSAPRSSSTVRARRARSRPAARVCSRPVLMRADRAAEHRLLERQPRRLRRVHAAQRGAAARGAQRAADGARGAHRADGGRCARRRQGAARARRCAARHRLRAGRPRGDRGAATGRRAADRRRRLLAAAARAGGGGRRRRRRRSRARPRPGRAGARRRSGADPARAPQLPPWLPGPPLRPAVVFECVGVPGVLDQIMAAAPRGSRIVVVGVCMEADTIYPMLGINKELNLQFVLGYTPEEFAATLRHIAEGAIPVDAADHGPCRRRAAWPRPSRISARPSATPRSSFIPSAERLRAGRLGCAARRALLDSGPFARLVGSARRRARPKVGRRLDRIAPKVASQRAVSPAGHVEHALL